MIGVECVSSLTSPLRFTEAFSLVIVFICALKKNFLDAKSLLNISQLQAIFESLNSFQ